MNSGCPDGNHAGSREIEREQMRITFHGGSVFYLQGIIMADRHHLALLRTVVDLCGASMLQPAA